MYKPMQNFISENNNDRKIEWEVKETHVILDGKYNIRGTIGESSFPYIINPFCLSFCRKYSVFLCS